MGGKGENDITKITGTNFDKAPKYVFATVDKWGTVRWFKIDDNRKVEDGRVNVWKLKDNWFGYGGASGARYYNDWRDSPFSGGTNDNDYNSYGTGDQRNNVYAVKRIKEPSNGFYTTPYSNYKYVRNMKVPQYLFKDVSGSDFVWKLFQKKDKETFCKSNYKRGECEPLVQTKCLKSDNFNCPEYVNHYCTKSRMPTNKFCNSYCFKKDNYKKCKNQLIDLCGGNNGKYVFGKNCQNLKTYLESEEKLEDYESDILNSIYNAQLYRWKNDKIDTIVNNSITKAFCKREDLPIGQREICDKMATDFCKSNHYDPNIENYKKFCACINNPFNFGSYVSLVCDEQYCMGGEGYKRNNEIQAKEDCPPCSQKTIQQGGISVDNQQTLNCNITQQITQNSSPEYQKLLPPIEERDLTQWEEVKEKGKLKMRIGNSPKDLSLHTFIAEDYIKEIEFNNYKIMGSNAENYSMIIYGYITPPQTGNYTFYANVDDTLEFKLNNTIIFNIQSYTNNKFISSNPIYLEKEKWYRIKLTHIQYTGAQKLELRWACPTVSNLMNMSKIDSQYFASGTNLWKKLNVEISKVNVSNQGQLTQEEQNAVNILREDAKIAREINTPNMDITTPNMDITNPYFITFIFMIFLTFIILFNNTFSKKGGAQKNIIIPIKKYV